MSTITPINATEASDVRCERMNEVDRALAIAEEKGGSCASLSAVLRTLSDEHGVFLSPEAVNFLCSSITLIADDDRKGMRAVLVAALEEVLRPLEGLSNTLVESINANPTATHWLEFGAFGVGVRKKSKKSLNLHGKPAGKVLDFIVREFLGAMPPRVAAGDLDRQKSA